MDLDTAEEVSLSLCGPEQKNNSTRSDCDVNAVLDAREDSDKDTGEKDENFEGRDQPELVNGVWWRDQITNGVDDNCREGAVRDVVEDGCKEVDCEENDDPGNDTSEWGTDTSLGLDSCARERSSGWVSTEEGADDVGDTDCNHFLRRVDGVIVDATERLGNCLREKEVSVGNIPLKKKSDERELTICSINMTMTVAGSSDWNEEMISLLITGTPMWRNPLGTVCKILKMGFLCPWLTRKEMSVNSKSTNAVLSVAKKNQVFCCSGNFLVRKDVVNHLNRYSKNSADRPIAASSFVEGRCLKLLMMTKYVGPRVLNPDMPIKFETCPAAMLMAEPVMNAAIAVSGIYSTTKPSRNSPNKVTMEPAMSARPDAMACPERCGEDAITFPTSVDMTATGPMVMSLEVAKNQYIMTPTKLEYSPNSTGRFASFAYATRER